MSSVTFADVQTAEKRISPFINKTPVLESQLLNSWLGHKLFFKAECFQKTGAFKLRGALNMMLKAKEEGRLGNQVVASSSGNHAQAVAYAAKILGVKATIYSAQNLSKVKAAATKYYGASLDLSATRKEADEKVAEAASKSGVLWMPPFNHNDIIAGQGTAALEAIGQTGEVNSVFAPVGGGGLVSGSLLSTRALLPKASVIGAEPLVANDAAESLRTGVIQSLTEQPNTLADGAATLQVGEKTFPHLQALDGFYEVDETTIAYWTQWLQHLLKIHVEPTCAMSMGAVVAWLKSQTSEQKVLVMLSGGNIDQQKMRQIWQDDHLQQIPSLLI
ncbi:serine/threonine dehydratase [Paraglaciecola sp. MB-3u-78]|uniref:serine/threonine dehydratase n=1 Tax=Paraglaciecola sp. MB-3u-78 TaxID=2058332 RepID=UPI000C34965C|nr:serine/threonine dehydratase [Paraglaciecola sp. MB-3u-78]PKG98217.1 serine/threonine dehydratase [Paraglaciecola sp. MB-3u-78]